VTSSPETSKLPDDDITSAVRFLAVELPELLGLTGTVHTSVLEALAAVLADAHAFDDLSPADATRVAEVVAFEAIRADLALADATARITDRAIAVQLDRGSDLDDMGCGLALHRAAAALEA
jgi:hypothetical protein